MAKTPVVDVTELDPESSSTGSDSDQRNNELSQVDLEQNEEDTTIRRIPYYDQDSELFDEKHDTESIDPDVTIETILKGKISFPSGTSRRAVSAQESQTNKRDSFAAYNQSFTASENGEETGINGNDKIQVPKRRIQISSQPLVPSGTAKRSLSTETTATNSLGRLSSGTQVLKSLPIEERLVKTHTSLKELQNICSLPVARERVTLQRVFELIDKIRMRQVPHQWSTVDRRLKQVQSSVERVADFTALVKEHGSEADSVASMFYAACELALAFHGKGVDSVSLDGLLNIFHRVTSVLQHVKLSMPERIVSSQSLYGAFAKMTQALQHICVGFVEMLDELKRKGTSQGFTAFGHQVNRYFETDMLSLTTAANEVCQELWLISMKTSADSSLGSAYAHVLEWLEIHSNQHRKSGHGFSRGHRSGKETFPFVFDCVEPLVVKFFKTASRLLLVTGEAGYGEQQLSFNLVERLQLALPVEAKLLRASFCKSSNLPTCRTGNFTNF